MTTLAQLLELSEKATKGEWKISDFAIHGEPKAEENATFITALVNWFREEHGNFDKDPDEHSR